MATPGQLLQTISETTGVPIATVVDIDRKLVKAGLRRKGGRGLHAARMGSYDAACLLTGILTCAHASEAEAAVRRYIYTGIDAERSSRFNFGATKLEDLSLLPDQHGFVDAFAILISSAQFGSLAELTGAGDGQLPKIEVLAFTRATRALIRLSGLPNRRTANVEYVPVLDEHHAMFDPAPGDLEQSRRITERTIFAVAELLGMERGNERARK